MMNRFLLTCLSVAREFVPLRKLLPKHKHKIPKDRRILMRCRRRIIQQQAVATGGARRDALNRHLAEIEKSLQQSNLQQADFEEDRAVENIKRNPKFFYAYARKFSKIKVGIGPLIDATNSLITCPGKMAEILAEQCPDTHPHDLFPNEPLDGSPSQE